MTNQDPNIHVQAFMGLEDAIDGLPDTVNPHDLTRLSRVVGVGQIVFSGIPEKGAPDLQTQFFENARSAVVATQDPGQAAFRIAMEYPELSPYLDAHTPDQLGQTQFPH